MGPIEVRESLLKVACQGGGWSYSSDHQPHLEPTCLALLALTGDPAFVESHLPEHRAFLQSCAVGDGTFRLGRGRKEAVWTTALTIYTLAVIGDSAAVLEPSLRALLAIKGRSLDNRGEEDINDIDGALIGWPWGEDNFSWIEPTAWACLALRRLGQGDHPRVRQGQQLLLNRTLENGGVNYGNRRILKLSLEPIPTPTSLMLLALQGTGDDPRITKSIEYLQHNAETTDDLEHLCWSVLALDAYRQPGKPCVVINALKIRIENSLTARDQTPYLKQSPLRLALAALALDVDRRNPFRLPSDVPTVKPLEPGLLSSSSPPIGQRVKSFIQGMALSALTALKPVDSPSNVHIATATDYNADLVDVLCRQFEHFREKLSLAGKRVVLKPNLVEYHRNKVINTHPNFVAAVIDFCRREKAGEVIVAEGPGHWRNVEYLVAASGLGDVLRHYKVPFVDLNHDEPVRRPNMGRLTKLEHLYLSQTIATADVVISLPKLKTHHWAVATLSLKNLFGTVPGICYGWPKNELHWRGIDNSIVDIALTRTPDLAIVDGIVGMEGDGPLNGTAKPMNLIIMGTDLLAVDATCCRLMQLDPTRVGYLVMGNRKKLGNLQEPSIIQLGETIESRKQPFDTVDHFKPLWMGRGA